MRSFDKNRQRHSLSAAVVGHALSADVAAVARTLVRAGVARRAQIEAIDTACNLQARGARGGARSDWKCTN